MKNPLSGIVTDIESVANAAEAEVQKELQDAAKTAIKEKLKAIAAAKKIVQNLENELEALKADLQGK